ncbi:MAG: GNAT family N-acetyltransferase [Oscillospiraceae bacterium]|jgi:GNAT superfamily N-acetyltransferase|nr:GNAT family N-acetyltransferase [Oscillospiraceae bacterium]
MDIEFCELEKKHLESLMNLYRQFGIPADKTTDIELIFEDSLNKGVKYFGAIKEDTVISTCYIAVIPNLTHYGRPIGFIENVITDEKYRRQGLGRKVMQLAINYAKEQNCNKVCLLSGSHRTEAHKFYKDLGFDGDFKRGFVITFWDY